MTPELAGDPPVATLGQPAAVRARLTERAAALGPGGLDQDTTAVLDLVLREPRPLSRISNLILRVFLNRPGANSRTAVTDPTYLGSISLFASGEDPDAPGPERFRLPLRNAGALLAPDPGAGSHDPGPLVTVVAVPIRPDDVVESASVEILSATIDVR